MTHALDQLGSHTWLPGRHDPREEPGRGKAARRDLCGGRPAMVGPTAMTRRRADSFSRRAICSLSPLITAACLFITSFCSAFSASRFRTLR